ncbi:hypothetical protein JL720_2016 [Aureococcus anophagefferens]|nr:hypothetical protein JL720_2016 [Aureococcus anophagefferens]
MHQCCLSLSGQRRLEPRKAMGYYQRPLLDKPQGVHEVSTWQEYERWKASNTQKVEDRPCQAIIAVSEASTLRLVDEACGLPWAMRIACEIPPDFDDGEELNACLIQPAACAFGKTPSVDVQKGLDAERDEVRAAMESIGCTAFKRVPIGGLGPAKDDHLAFLERAHVILIGGGVAGATAAELSLGAWEVYGFFTRFSIDESIKWRHFQGAVLVGVGPGASVFSGRVWHVDETVKGLEDHEPRKLESRDAMTMFGGKQMIVAPGFIVDEAMASVKRWGEPDLPLTQLGNVPSVFGLLERSAIVLNTDGTVEPSRGYVTFSRWDFRRNRARETIFAPPPREVAEEEAIARHRDYGSGVKQNTIIDDDSDDDDGGDRDDAAEAARVAAAAVARQRCFGAAHSTKPGPTRASRGAAAKLLKPPAAPGAPPPPPPDDAAELLDLVAGDLALNALLYPKDEGDAAAAARAAAARRARTADDVDAAAALDARDVHGSWRVAKALAKRAALANLATLELAGAAFGPTLASRSPRASAARRPSSWWTCATRGAATRGSSRSRRPCGRSRRSRASTSATTAHGRGAAPLRRLAGPHGPQARGRAFADAAPEPASPYLEILDLSRNALGAARSPGVNAVAAWLASPGAAPALDLGSNALTMRHVERLLNAALKAPELRTLDLRGCRSTPALATSVARRTRFTRLDVLLGDAPKSKRASPE